jgi:tetratricopeptide (TPR) repeat protein
MKKRFIYIGVLFLFAVTSGFIILKYKSEKGKKESELYQVIPRKGNSIQTREWETGKKFSTELIEKIKVNPSDAKSLLALTALYLQEARASGNFAYYDKAAMNCVNNVLKSDAKNFEALTYKAMIFLSQHHFADGLAIANQVVKTNPYNAFVFGILVDANVELGDYKSAVENAEKMISIRPDIRSYSRISYLREIHGDLAGAIDAMKLAVDAGSPGTEGTEWTRVQLGKLYEQTGEMKYAEMNYTIALQNRPEYPYALAGLARLAIAAKDYEKAIQLYSKAGSESNDYSFEEALVEVYKLNGELSHATSIANEIIEEMARVSENAAKDNTAGHYADREMAYAYLAVNNYDKALEHALLEYNRRPGNIDVNETVAWVYYNKKNYAEAESYIRTALKTNCKNPSLLCHAGLIYLKAGDKTSAKNYLQEALRSHPDLSPGLETAAEQALHSL